MFYMHGHKNILPRLEEALAGKSVGDTLSVTLPPEHAFGARQEGAESRVPIKHLLTRAKKYRPGMVVKVNTKEGARDVTIIKVGKFNVDVDFNHPYAGKTITFEIDIDGIREATSEELSHGHAHGADGHASH